MPKRTDLNHSEIRELFRKKGFSWADTFTVGKGFPDGVVGNYGVTYLIEVKSPGGKLTSGQERFIDTWKGSPVEVVEDEQDVDRVIVKMLNAALPKVDPYTDDFE